MRSFAPAALALALVSTGCGTSVEARDAEPGGPAAPPRARGPARVVGTALEAATGRPIRGARIEGPGGVLAESDAEGRFELRGLELGAVGVLRATAPGGLEGENPLRALQTERLEVVIYLR